MFKAPVKRHHLASLLCLCAVHLVCVHAETSHVSFNYEVRPVLAAKCFSCHGSDIKNRKGKLRLDDRDAAIEKKAIVPGDPKASELITHILTSDPDEVMPPPDKNQALTKEEKSILER
ncbi:MAG: hypothetical protein JWO08_3233 [Verrucomicrobiaceae bacterium]|nr:hypothetical protein [Verrucomicrobiaceae bacterium]